MSHKNLCWRILPFLTLFAVLSISACHPAVSSENWDKENTRLISPGDTSYLNAISKAQQELPAFLDSIKNKENKDYTFFVKSRYEDGKMIEHLWFKVDSFNDGHFQTILDNVPLQLKNIKLNDKVSFTANQIEDWMIYEGDSMIAGGFLLQVMP